MTRCAQFGIHNSKLFAVHIENTRFPLVFLKLKSKIETFFVDMSFPVFWNKKIAVIVSFYSRKQAKTKIETRLVSPPRSRVTCHLVPSVLSIGRVDCFCLLLWINKASAKLEKVACSKNLVEEIPICNLFGLHWFSEIVVFGNSDIFSEFTFLQVDPGKTENNKQQTL